MKLQDVSKIVDNKVREVAKVFSQNSTALAREMTINIAIKDIMEAVETLLQEKEINDSPEVKSRSRK